MSEEQRAKILQVPRSIHPIVGIHDHVSEEPDPPFFGFAPSETPVRLVICSECNQPVSAAHLLEHQKQHETAKQEPSNRDESFHLQTKSRLLPPTPCPYAKRQSYPFRHLFDDNKKGNQS